MTSRAISLLRTANTKQLNKQKFKAPGATDGEAVGVLTLNRPDRKNALGPRMAMELDAIFAVVVGGTALTGERFNLLGSIIGALLIQTLTTTMITQGMPTAIAPVPKAVVIVAVCLLQSGKFRAEVVGWFGRRATPSRRARSTLQTWPTRG